MNNKYYVYELIDPRDFITFYVGKGCNNRIYEHEKVIKEGKIHYNWKLHKKIKELLDLGLKIEYKKFCTNVSEQFAFDMEIWLIKLYGKENLCNMTDGGDGIDSELRLGKTYEEIYGSKERADEINKKRTKTRRERDNYKHTEETKKKLSIKSSIPYNEKFGVERSAEIRKKQSESKEEENVHHDQKNGIKNKVNLTKVKFHGIKD